MVRALLALAAEPRTVGEVFNVGHRNEITILELAERIKAITGTRSRVVKIPYDEAYEVGFEDMPRRVPALDKIREFTGWEPELGLDEILTDVVEYWRTR